MTALPVGATQVQAVDGHGAAAALPGSAPVMHPLWQAAANVPAASALDAWPTETVDPRNLWDAADEAYQAAAADAYFSYTLAQEDLPPSPSQHVPAAAAAQPGEVLGQVRFAMDMDYEPIHAAAAPAMGDGDANAPIGCVDPASSVRIELIGLFQTA